MPESSNGSGRPSTYPWMSLGAIGQNFTTTSHGIPCRLPSDPHNVPAMANALTAPTMAHAAIAEPPLGHALGHNEVDPLLGTFGSLWAHVEAEWVA